MAGACGFVTGLFGPEVRDAARRSVLCWLATADPAFACWVAPLRELAGERFPIRSVFVVRAVEVEAVVAPSYVLFPDGTTEASQERAALRAYGVVRVDGATNAAAACAQGAAPLSTHSGSRCRRWRVR